MSTDYTYAIRGLKQRDLCMLGPTTDSGPLPKRVAWLVLQDDGVVSIRAEYQIGTEVTPEPVYHGRWLRWSIPSCTDVDDLSSGLGPEGELSRLLDAVKAGHTSGWDGNNFVGSLTWEAQQASEFLAYAMQGLMTVAEGFRTASDYFAENRDLSRELICSRLQSGQSLKAVAEDLVANAEINGVYLEIWDVAAYFRKILA